MLFIHNKLRSQWSAGWVLMRFESETPGSHYWDHAPRFGFQILAAQAVGDACRAMASPARARPLSEQEPASGPHGESPLPLALTIPPNSEMTGAALGDGRRPSNTALTTAGFMASLR